MRVNFQGGERVRIVRIALRGGGGCEEQQDDKEWRPPADEQHAAGMTTTRAALIKEHVSLGMYLNRPKEWRPPADAQGAVGMSLALLRVCVRARRYKWQQCYKGSKKALLKADAYGLHGDALLGLY